MALGVDGLVSGLDTTSIISGLMAVEAKPQTLLKNQLTATQAKASAYRAVNTRFDAIRTAAEALTASAANIARSATSSSTSVGATATSSAVPGSSVTVRVDALATSQETLTKTGWSSRTALASEAKPAWPIKVLDASGTTVGTISLAADATLADAVAAINGSGYGVHATVVQVGANEFRLKVTSDATGPAGARTIQGADETSTTGDSFTVTTPATKAAITVDGGFALESDTNTFPDVLTGVSLTVGKVDAAGTTPALVRVGTDTSALAGKVQALVDAANGALGVIKGYTTSTAGSSTATLQGDRTLVQLSDQLLDAVSSAIGGKSAASIGLQLTRDGKLAFDSAVFTAKLAADPAAVTQLISGRAAATVNGVGTPAVAGIASKLAALAKTASDSSTGTLVSLANGRDTLAKGIQDKIDAFDIRLTSRRDSLNKQFSALETALNTIKNQSSWLSSQVNQLYNPNKSS